MRDIQDNLNLILDEITTVFQVLDASEIRALVQAIIHADKVFVTGVGRVLLSLEAFVKRLNHLGIPAYYVGQIDEPCATGQDLLIVSSNSGESLIPLSIARKAHSLGVPVAYIGSSRESSAGKLADLTVLVPVSSKRCETGRIQSRQPMTSLFEQVLLLLGDAIAMAIIEQEQLVPGELWKCHANLE